MMEQEGKSMETQPIGYLVLVKTHTKDARKILDCPEKVRGMLGYQFDNRGLDEEIDYTLEVEHMYVTPDERYQKQHADHIAALAAKDAAISVLKGAVHADVAEFSRDSATLEAQAEQIRVLREALAAVKAPVQFAEVLDYAEDPKIEDESTRVCFARAEMVMAVIWRRLMRAALASTAPVAEAGQPADYGTCSICRRAQIGKRHEHACE